MARHVLSLTALTLSALLGSQEAKAEEFYCSSYVTERAGPNSIRYTFRADAYPFEASPQDAEDVTEAFKSYIAKSYFDGDTTRFTTRCKLNWFDGNPADTASLYKRTGPTFDPNLENTTYLKWTYDPNWRKEEVASQEQPTTVTQNDKSQRDLGKDESYGYCIWQYTNVVNPKKSKALISGVFPYKDFSLTTVNDAWSNHVLANYDVSGNGLVCFDAGKTSYEEAVSIRDREQAQLKSIYKTVIATGWLWRGSTRPSVRATSTPASRTRASTRGKAVQKPVQKRR